MPFMSPNQQCQSTDGKVSHSLDLLTPSSPGVFQPCLWPLKAPGYLGGHWPSLSSALWCQYPVSLQYDKMKYDIKTQLDFHIYNSQYWQVGHTWIWQCPVTMSCHRQNPSTWNPLCEINIHRQLIIHWWLQTCQCPLTVKHILVECTDYNDTCNKYSVASSTSTEELFRTVDIRNVYDKIKDVADVNSCL